MGLAIVEIAKVMYAQKARDSLLWNQEIYKDVAHIFMYSRALSASKEGYYINFSPSFPSPLPKRRRRR